jgi:hypothetical protein
VRLRFGIWVNRSEFDVLARLEVSLKLARGFNKLIANEEIRKIR